MAALHFHRDWVVHLHGLLLSEDDGRVLVQPEDHNHGHHQDDDAHSKDAMVMSRTALEKESARDDLPY